MLPSDALPSRVRDELRARRAPALTGHERPGRHGSEIGSEDGRAPAPAPPPTLAWHERYLVRIGRDQYLLTIPCVGRGVVSGVDAELTERLRERWLGAAPGQPWTISSVVAAFDHSGVHSARLVLAISATGRSEGSRLDSPQMARDITRALESLTTPLARSRVPSAARGYLRQPG